VAGVAAGVCGLLLMKNAATTPMPASAITSGTTNRATELFWLGME
jgi:hypothetical protein